MKRRLSLAALLIGIGMTIVPIPVQAASASTTNLGTLGGNFAQTSNISGDGATLIGFSDPPAIGQHAFIWTQTRGMTQFSSTLRGAASSQANAASYDGTVIVGNDNLAYPIYWHAYRWTQAGGIVDLGTFGGDISEAYGVSYDGSVVVGLADYSNNTVYRAFRWTQAGGMVDLGTLGGANSVAYGTSADGKVVVGESVLSDNRSMHAFRWTQAGGMKDLGTLGGSESGALAVSGDGVVVVGDASINGSSWHAFRWTQGRGMTDLGTLGGTDSIANSVSATGKVIVGNSQISGDSVYHAFRWTQATGMQDLNTLLSNAGVNMTGITLTTATGVSANGQYISGNEMLTQYASASWQAYLISYSDGTLDGFTTAADLQRATQNLSNDQQSMLIQSRSTAGEILGMTRPVDETSYAFTGGMFGSAVGYAGEQFSSRGVTLLGGFAYGAQDYANIKQDAAPTIAAALRYTFDDPFEVEDDFAHPFIELGGWATPETGLTLSRSYANGAFTSTGVGTTQATSWAEYGRFGLTSEVRSLDKVTCFAELGQQYLSFSDYNENATSNNPFPASVSGGVSSMDIVRMGSSWTHKLEGFSDKWDDIPVSITLAGAAAQSFDVQSSLTTAVAGIGSSTASNQSDTWGEYGARIEGRLTKQVALDLDVNGITGGGAIGTAIHGGIGISYKF